jgi:hypothetical protein
MDEAKKNDAFKHFVAHSKLIKGEKSEVSVISIYY